MSERPDGPGGPATMRNVRTSRELRSYARGRLIESRLTPNAISMTGLVLNLAAAALILDKDFVLGAIAFIVGSIMDTLDGRYSRMSGKGSLFGAFLDSTLDRVEEGVVIAAVAWTFADDGKDVAAAVCVLVVLGSLMVSLHAGAGRGARGRVQGRDRHAAGAGRAALRRAAVRLRRVDLQRRPAPCGDLRDGCADRRSRPCSGSGTCASSCRSSTRAADGRLSRRRSREQPVTKPPRWCPWPRSGFATPPGPGNCAPTPSRTARITKIRQFSPSIQGGSRFTHD